MTLTFLVVDDNETDRELLTSLIRSTGNVALLAAGGDEALLLAAEHRPDVILLDLAMPGTDGFDVLAALAADDDLRAIRVISVSWLSPEDIRAHLARTPHPRAASAQIDSSVEKPVLPTQFIAMVRAMSGAPAAPARAPQPTRRSS